MGTAVGDWGSDSFGTHEPFTVLSPDGTASHPDVIIVSITGYEGYQGGLEQASASYASESQETLTIGGRAAIYTPAHTDPRATWWADLVAGWGDDLAVRVTSPDATREELVGLLDHVQVWGDRTTAPAVDPPDGYEMVGSVDVGGVLASDLFVALNTDEVPGPEGAHSAGWVRADDESAQLVVATLPGAMLDLAALPGGEVRRRWEVIEWSERELAGSRVLVENAARREDGSDPRRAVYATSPWGDIIVVAARGPALPSEAELLAIAATVTPTDPATWEAFVIEATGGPGLHPDPGRTEIARGMIGDREWLLQNGPPGAGYLAGSGIDESSLRGVDPCLKLSDRTRACPGGGGGGSVDDWIYSTAPGEDHGLSFVVLSTTVEAASVRVRTSSDEAAAPLAPVPGGGLWAAVIFVDDPGLAVCDPTVPPPDHLDTMVVEALDAAGAVVACLALAG